MNKPWLYQGLLRFRELVSFTTEAQSHRGKPEDRTQSRQGAEKKGTSMDRMHKITLVCPILFILYIDVELLPFLFPLMHQGLILLPPESHAERHAVLVGYESIVPE